QHPRGLNNFVRTVSDPASPRYRDYATVAQLVNRFGAKPQTKKQVVRWFAARGLHAKVIGSGTHAIVSMTGAQASRLLPPADGAAASVTGLDRNIPAGLEGAVTGISVVSAAPVVQPLAGPAVPTEAAASASKEITAADFGKPYRSILLHSGTAGGCPAGSSGGEPGLPPFTPNQYLTAYGHSDLHAKGFKGQGQTVAVVETGGFKHSDIAAFAKCFGIAKPPPIKVVPVEVPKPLPGEDETTLDLSMLAVGAPKLDKIYVYEGLESLGGIALTAGSALGTPGHQPDVISISLGYCENELNGNMGGRDALDSIFAVAAGAGISVLVSAGDQGSTGCRTAEAGSEELTALPMRAVSLPASSPYVTAVGGTNLGLTPKNKIKVEVVWNNSVIIPWGGGGGGSIITPRTPWWQAGISSYGHGRKVPDIAALADIYPGYAFFCTAASCKPERNVVYGWSKVGGTSAAAPLTAAGIALVNQYAAKQGQPPLGFLNPLLYDLGASAKSRASSFNDVTIGNNDIGIALPPEAGGGVPVGCCQAKPGYDWASGWGSLKLPSFAKAAVAAGN
ncbi:MAG TPA: S53 family peptidase, partial [Solirubrobacterales bacterium]|nr:S53 family peptidase [Solirubrobacterales bacterium]